MNLNIQIFFNIIFEKKKNLKVIKKNFSIDLKKIFLIIIYIKFVNPEYICMYFYLN